MGGKGKCVVLCTPYGVFSLNFINITSELFVPENFTPCFNFSNFCNFKSFLIFCTIIKVSRSLKSIQWSKEKWSVFLFLLIVILVRPTQSQFLSPVSIDGSKKIPWIQPAAKSCTLVIESLKASINWRAVSFPYVVVIISIDGSNETSWI